MDQLTVWKRFQEFTCHAPSIGISLDLSRMNFPEGYPASMEPRIQEAMSAMEALEKGAIANPDEKRMVGHYWLRSPDSAPTEAIRSDIAGCLARLKVFVADVHAGRVAPPKAEKFTRVLSVGIGGSALGPMFVSDALGHPSQDRMQVHFIDNTDPDGIERTLSAIGPDLAETLCVVTSKSGGTPETRNGMLAVQAAYQRLGLEFSQHAVAITMAGSKMDQVARKESWRACFPMFDWVGGRTSETSAVGLLPAALQGLDIDGLLAGAAACDQVTRSRRTLENPAALLALMWHHATGGRGLKDMVVLPYKDRLLLFSRYLQQLIMESLGKREDLQGNRVDQGITVYGNKGSTDQHAYVQQLRDGVNNFFVTFIRVLETGRGDIQVDDESTAGDYLHGFLLGTRQALHENDRESMTLTVQRVDARAIGALIALFERAVGFYATLIGINAYHQPGVEAGKKAAAAVLSLQNQILKTLTDEGQTAGQIAGALDEAASVETVYLVLEYLVANGRAQWEQDVSMDRTRFRR